MPNHVNEASPGSPVDHNWRWLLQAAAVAPTLLFPVGPAWASALDVTRLHPTRFGAGLILDIASAVLVEVASDYILGQLRDGQLLGGTVIVSASLPVNEGGRRGSVGTFDHVGYKVSVVRLGVVDYREHQRRTLALELKGAAQDGRFAALRDYLRDEKVRVKLGDATHSAFLGADLTPDDLFTLDYLDVPDERLPTHYRNLIDASGAQVFDRWYG